MTSEPADDLVLPPPDDRTPAYYAGLTPQQRLAAVQLLTKEAWVLSGRTWPPPSIPRGRWPVRVITRAEHDAEESFEKFLRRPAGS